MMSVRATDQAKDIIRVGLRAYFFMHDFIIRIFADLFRHGNFVRTRTVADDPLRDSRRAAVYVHFSSNGTIADYVIHQLWELVGAGYRITFVSNSPTLDEPERAKLAPLCKEVIWRMNAGYDFGAYKDGLASIETKENLESLILMNDSVYGPFWSLQETLAAIDCSKVDFWGIADSLEFRRHLQTFFMVFFPATLRSSAFGRFWRKYPYVNNKRWVVRNAEVRLTRALERAALRVGVLAPFWSVAATKKFKMPGFDSSALSIENSKNFEIYRSRIMRDQKVNPMHYFWDTLIEDYRCPFIKRDLIQYNPAKIPGTSRWPQVIAANSGYDIGMIERHLKR